MRLWLSLCCCIALDWPSTALAEKLPADRIVSLAPHLTEIVFAVGAGEKLVGVSSYSDYPAQAMRLPVVSDNGKINIEAVLSLKPDLVLAWQSGSRATDLDRLEQYGLKVLRTEARSYEEVGPLLRQIGALTGTLPIAEAHAAEFEARMNFLRNKYAKALRVRSFVEIWHSPLMSVNDKHVISSLVDLCGGVNVLAQAEPLTPTVSVETLYAINADVILTVAFKAPDQARAAWAKQQGLSAVKDDKVYALSPDLLSRMSPRIAQGAEVLCAALDNARTLNANRNVQPSR